MQIGGNSLHAIYIFRREDDRSIANLRSIGSAETTPGVTFTVIDKSLRGATAHVEGLARRKHVRILRRPRDETQFASLAQCTSDGADWVIQLHDDDTWSGIPDPRHLNTQSACYWSRTSLHDDPSVKGLSLPNIFFGAIRQDVWAAFISFVKQQPHPCPGVDQVVVFWCRQLGIAGPIPNYIYDYNWSNWAEFESAKATNRSLAEATGWGQFSDSEAMQWTIYIDTLVSLAPLSQFIGVSRARDIARRMLRRTPPFAIPGPVGGLANQLPTQVRQALVETRGQGRTTRRLMEVARRSLRRGVYNGPPMIHGGLGSTTLKHLDQAVLSQLGHCGEPWIEDRARVWHEQLVGLSRSIMGESSGIHA